jgi:hypothetical protein
MTAREFDDATPREVGYRLDALHFERNRELRNVAQLAAWVLTPFSKDGITVEDLVTLPDSKQQQEKFDWGKWLKG